MASDHDDDVPSLSRLLLLTADVFPPLAATTRADFAVRTRAGEDLGSMPVADFLAKLRADCIR